MGKVPGRAPSRRSRIRQIGVVAPGRQAEAFLRKLSSALRRNRCIRCDRTGYPFCGKCEPREC